MMHDTLPYASEDLMIHRIFTCELEDKINQAKEMHEKIGIFAARRLIQEKAVKKGFTPFEAAKISRGEGLVVAVINSGIDISHPEIRGRFKPGEEGRNFVSWKYLTNGKRVPDLNFNENDLSSKVSHCLGVAGILAARRFGIINRARLYAIKVCDDKKHGKQRQLRDGINHAREKGVDLVNMSVGSVEYEQLFTDRLKDLCYEYGQEVVLVSSAGNAGIGPSLPASLPNVISVAATGCTKRDKDYHTACSFTSRWHTTDVAAPGKDILVLYNKDELMEDYSNAYGTMSGTSSATPIVTSVVGMAISYLKCRNKTLVDEGKSEERIDPQKLAEILKGTACTSKRKALPFYHSDRDVEYVYGQCLGFHALNPDLKAEDFRKFAMGAGRIDAEKFVREVIKLYP